MNSAWQSAGRSNYARQQQRIGGHRVAAPDTQRARAYVQPHYGNSLFGFKYYWGHANELPHWPGEGWKLHLAASAWHAQELADLVCPLLVIKGFRSKIVATSKGLTGMIAEQTGKFITIYPQNLYQAYRIVDMLEPYLAKLPAYLKQAARAPFDKPIGTSRILTTRYGAFQGKTISDASGTGFAPDKRVGSYKPDWIVDPWTPRLATGRSDISWPGKW